MMEPTIASANRQVAPPDTRLPYMLGLDGLRALAVAAVLLYHADLPVYGGFLGVESFFVLSGFLITGLLLTEWRQHGRIQLTAFWLRRARRLLPALVLLLTGTLLVAGIRLRGERLDLGADVLAALAYGMNWHLIASGQSYFDPTTRPPLLQHLWSLAVEEQFYLVWPLLFGAGLRYLRSSVLLITLLATAVASTVWMGLLHEPGGNLTRLYYGTDTRAAGLLLGAALAMVWTPGHIPAANSRRVGRLLDLAGLAALGGLLAAYAWWHAQHPLLYQGGFAVAAAATAVLIAAVTHPRVTLISGVLSYRPLRWLGVRSYGIYLWHWPVFQLTRPSVDVPLDGLALLALRLAIVVLLAELSYQLVELPVRRGALGTLWQRLRRRPGRAVARHAARGRHRAPLLGWRRWQLASAGMVVLTIGSCTADLTSPLADSAQRRAAVTAAQAAGTTPLAAAVTADATASATPMASTTPTASATPTAAPATTIESATAMATAAPATLPVIDPALAEALQRVLDATVADGTVPGVVLSVNVPGYQPWSGASGLADPQQQVAMLPDTPVRIGSLTKLFTAVAVLQLAEEGLIELDTPINTWLPELLEQGDTITVRQLLNHTTGLYDYLEDRSFVEQAYTEAGRVRTPDELVAYAQRFPSVFAPGTEGAWDYSSTNYVVLGMLVEQVTGQALGEVLQQRILAPLELTHTSFVLDGVVAGQALGFSGTTDRTAVAMSFGFGTANIVSTVADLERFAEALFGGQLLQRETMAAMQTFVDGHGQYNMPALEYGLGLMRNQLQVGTTVAGQERDAQLSTVLGHIGGFGGFRAALWHAPGSGITIALSVNQGTIDPNTVATTVLDTVLTYQGH